MVTIGIEVLRPLHRGTVPRLLLDYQTKCTGTACPAGYGNPQPPAPDFERTAENSESPALLGGVQVLVDGGRLVFQRPAADLPLVEGLWTLLPHGIRGKLWPPSGGGR